MEYGPDGKKIEGDGVEKLFHDLQVDMEDPVTLLISFYMNAKEQGEYKLDEFKHGCNRMGVDSLAGMKKLVPDLKKALKSDAKLFKSVYSYTFEFTQDQGMKNIAAEHALLLWPILLGDKCSFMDKLLAFIES